MKFMKKRKSGQAMTEYIIIVAVIALAALTVFGLFGDTIRAKMNGIIAAFGGATTGTQGEDVTAGSSKDGLKNLNQDGTGAP
ncbi:MAG: Flp family type IVb pilin [Verrucomicrobiia bacterium]|jgi:type IV pilus assembly protein PilA